MQLEVKKKSRINPESVFLQNYRRDVTSQTGEDGIIEKIFQIIGETNRYCVEFGALDGKLFSNTWNLCNNHGWNGLLVEASKLKFPALAAEYADNDAVVTRNQLVRVSGKQSLDNILTEEGTPTDLDFLSIDIDGLDWHVWDSLTHFAPRLVVIEFNPSVPNDVIFVQDEDVSVNQGASLLALVELGKSKGYELTATTPWNGFFVRAELYPLFGIADNDIDAMHDPGGYESRLFQCYDGTLVLTGCSSLLWSQTAISQEDIQVLPASLRKYGDGVS